MTRTSTTVVDMILELGRSRCSCCGAGPSLRIIAEQAKVSHQTVANLFREHGITPPGKTIHFRRVPKHLCKGGCGGVITTEPCVLCMARSAQPAGASDG